jgi:cell division protein FtsW
VTVFWRKKKSTRGERKFALKGQIGRFDRLLVIAILGLTFFGILMIYDASGAAAFRDFRDRLYFVKFQALWGVIGLMAMFAASWVDFHKLLKVAPLLLLITIGLLLLVFVPSFSIEAYGAKRWLNLRFFVLQPSELAKLTFVIYLSACFSQRRNIFGFLFLTFLVVGLILLGKDMGTAVVISAVSLVLYFLSGAPLYHFFLILPPFVLSFLFLILKTPYRLKRVLTFFNPMADPLGASYHVRQVLIALGSGGLFGVGLGQSRQKYEYLPESFTDSIFAILGEELGFMGGVVVILVYLFIFFRGFKISQTAPDSFGNFLAAGLTTWLAIQTLINLAAMVALLPLTGLPLPFISYGGSNLVVSLVAVGILLNISQKKVTQRS